MKLSRLSRGLHVVEADDGVRVHREDALARRNAPFQPPRAPGGDGRGADMETNLQLGDPLVYEMRRQRTTVRSTSPRSRSSRAMSRASMVFPTPTSSAMREAHRIELEGHEQRHELVGARLDRDLPKAPEGSGAPPQREQQRVAQQEGRVVSAPSGARPARETGPRGPARPPAAGGSASDPDPSP